MIIGITDTMVSEDKFNYYVRWVEGSGTPVGWVKLSYKLDNLKVVNTCDGILLTGGNDVDPSLYSGDVSHPKITGIDKKRDDFERQIIDTVLSNNIPTLAICRGMQLVNVHLGGTLLPDIEDAGYGCHCTIGKDENYHEIVIDPESFLSRITDITKGEVNSSHHQAVDKPGIGLKISARAGDGIVEGMEFNNTNNPYFLLLQWHPERMTDKNNPLSKSILNKFITKISEQTTTLKDK